MNILVGMLTGATASMGLGGGFILLVYLSVFTEIPQDIAQGINLLFFLPIALLSLVIHIKNKLTDLKLVGKYLILGLPCAIAGSYVAGITDVAVLRKLFGIFVLYIGINQLYVSFTNKPCKKPDEKRKRLLYRTCLQPCCDRRRSMVRCYRSYEKTRSHAAGSIYPRNF